VGATPSPANTVEIAVRHGLREYVCVLRWNPTSETIDRVSIRRAGSQERLPPATENAVYRKALVDPRIRSRINEALFPSDKALVQSSGQAALDYQVDNTGLWLGLAVFALLGLAIYVADHYLARLLGVEAADLILALPAFFAIFVVVPVRNRYGHYARRRYCATHGHQLWEFDSKGGRRVVMCKRCSASLQGPRPG
jgi:hypothetical protein